jgi:hypothetical protein
VSIRRAANRPGARRCDATSSDASRSNTTRTSTMPRIFTGLEVPEEVAQSLAMLRGGLQGARWIDPENYHLTLRFIGDVDDVTAHEVASLLGRVRRPAL